VKRNYNSGKSIPLGQERQNPERNLRVQVEGKKVYTGKEIVKNFECEPPRRKAKEVDKGSQGNSIFRGRQ